MGNCPSWRLRTRASWSGALVWQLDVGSTLACPGLPRGTKIGCEIGAKLAPFGIGDGEHGPLDREILRWRVQGRPVAGEDEAIDADLAHRGDIGCARKGVERSSIADIWKEAGLSAGALYVHFKNKSDLITQCLRYSRTPLDTPPASWDELKKRLLGFDARRSASGNLADVGLFCSALIALGRCSFLGGTAF